MSDPTQRGLPFFSPPASSLGLDPSATIGSASQQPMQQSVIAMPSPQPDFWQQLAASPDGRYAYKNVVTPLEWGLNHIPAIPFTGPAPAHALTGAVDNWYQGALAASRNTPGYAPARAWADQQITQQPSNILDQILSGLSPVAMGTVGELTHGIDGGNAMMDAVQDDMDKYASAYPLASATANLAGDFEMPEPSDALGGILAAHPAVNDVISGINKWLDHFGDIDDIGKLGDALSQQSNSGGDLGGPDAAAGASQSNSTSSNFGPINLGPAPQFGMFGSMSDGSAPMITGDWPPVS